MIYLLDTHVLIWAATNPKRLSAKTQASIADPDNTILFSAASSWEIAIKAGLGRSDFRVDAASLRVSCLQEGYEEIPILAEEAIAAAQIDFDHKDPFDRLLLAQARYHNAHLLTLDAKLLAFGKPAMSA